MSNGWNTSDAWHFFHARRSDDCPDSESWKTSDAWYFAGDTKPVFAFHADGETTTFYDGIAESTIVFSFNLTNEQIAIANAADFIPGRYETWQQFCDTHGIASTEH